MKGPRRTGVLLGVLLLSLSAFSGEPPSPSAAPPSGMPAVTDVPEAATEAYLARIPAAAKARSDAYFEGGYWLILWDFLYGAAVLPLLLGLRWSARMRDLSERVSRFKPVRTLVYWAFFVVATAVLTFPLTLYAELVSDPNSSYVLHHV